MRHSSLLRVLALMLVFFSMCSFAQINFDKEQDFFFHNGNLLDTTLGKVTNVLSQLLQLDQDYFNTPEASQSLQYKALNYYGSQDFAILLHKANRHLKIQKLDELIPLDTKIRYPSPLLCVQFIGLDCILDSYTKSSQSTFARNFWKRAAAKIPDLSFYMTYPNYIYLVMSYLQDPVMSPAPQLLIKITNYLNADLVNGIIGFTTGFGSSPKRTIVSNEEATYIASRSDLLQGIHGTLSYDYQLISDETRLPLNINFHVYAGNGTLDNSVFMTQQVNSDFIMTSNGVQDIALTPQIRAQISITASPNAILNIVLYPQSASLVVPFKGIYKIIPSASSALEATWNQASSRYVLNANSASTTLYQGWKFVRVQETAFTANRFLIINTNSSLALEVDRASGSILLNTPNRQNNQQVWQVVPAQTSSQFYIKGANNLCLFVNPKSFDTTNANLKMVWLEPCLRSNLATFTFTPYNNYDYDL